MFKSVINIFMINRFILIAFSSPLYIININNAYYLFINKFYTNTISQTETYQLKIKM